MCLSLIVWQTCSLEKFLHFPNDAIVSISVKDKFIKSGAGIPVDIHPNSCSSSSGISLAVL